MPTISIHTDVDVSELGPMFDGRAEEAVEDFQEALLDELAQEGVNDVQLRLDRVLQHPTGYYRSHIRSERQLDSNFFVTDSGVVYGSWLEGESERNASTRFKGYHTFRIVAQELEAKVGMIAERVLDRFIPRMN